jgi:hypothetical protein
MIATDGETLATPLAYIGAEGAANALDIVGVKVMSHHASDIIFPKDLRVHRALPALNGLSRHDNWPDPRPALQVAVPRPLDSRLRRLETARLSRLRFRLGFLIC